MENKINSHPKSGTSLTLQLINSGSNPQSEGAQRSVTSGSKDPFERFNSNLNSSFNTYARSTSGGGYANQFTATQENQENPYVTQNSLENMPTRKMVAAYGTEESIGSSKEINPINFEDQYNVYEQDTNERNEILSKAPKQHYSRYNSKSNEVSLNHSMISLSSKSYAYSDNLDLLKRTSNQSNNSQKLMYQSFEPQLVSIKDLSSDRGSVKLGEQELALKEQHCKELLERKIGNGEQNTAQVADLYLDLASYSINPTKKREVQEYIDKAWTICSRMSTKYEEVILLCQKMANVLTKASKLKIDCLKYRSAILSLLDGKKSSTHEKERAETIIAISFEDYKESNKRESLASLINGLNILKKTLGENHIYCHEKIFSVQRMIFEKKIDFVALNQDDEAKPFLEDSVKLFEKTPNHVVCLLNLAKLYNDMELYEKALENYSKAKQICSLQKARIEAYERETESNILKLKKRVQKTEEVNKTKRKVALEKHNFTQKVSEEGFLE